MKQVVQFFFVALLFASGTLNAQVSKAQETKTPEAVLVSSKADYLNVNWNTMKHDYGNIPQGIPAKADFVLTNNGNEPLVITNVKGSCGCTATAHSEDPVLPGESTTITATYNAKKEGPFTKYVKVTTNQSETPVKLQILGVVEASK